MHIINLCSGQVVHAATGAVVVDNDTHSLSSVDNDDAHCSLGDDTHPAPNPIEAACVAVQAIQGSGQH